MTTTPNPTPSLSGASRRMRRRVTRASRIPALLVVLIALAGLIFWSVSSKDTANPSLASYGPSTVAPIESESSTFTCTGIWAGPPTPTLQIQLTNAASATRTARVELVNSAGERAVKAASIKANSTLVVPIGGMVEKGGDAAAFVTIDGGGVGVAEVSAISGNVDSAPCASSSSDHWYFAGGSTQEHDVMAVSIANPTSSTAVANLTLTTTDGLVVPGEGQGIVLAPHGVASLTLNSLAPHRDAVGAIVSATKGSVVSTMTRSRGTPGGDSIVLGAPSLESHLMLPAAVASPGATMTLSVSNPTLSDQKVTVTARIASGQLSPWTQSVPARSIWNLTISPTSRVPLTSVYSLEVTSSGPGVAAELELLASRATTAGLSNVVLTNGSSFTAGRWLLSATSSDPASLVFGATTNRSVTLHVARLGAQGPQAVAGLDGTVIKGNGTLEATAAQLARLGGHPLLIWADGPLATAERLAGGALPDGVTTLYAEPIRQP